MLFTTPLTAGKLPEMITEMTGEHFDGLLNFGVVLVRSKTAGKVAVLDAVQTICCPCTENTNKLVLSTVFENDFSEVLEISTSDDGKYDGYEMVQDCLPLLDIDDVEVITSLELLDDVQSCNANIARVQELYLDFRRSDCRMDKKTPITLVSGNEI